MPKPPQHKEVDLDLLGSLAVYIILAILVGSFAHGRGRFHRMAMSHSCMVCIMVSWLYIIQPQRNAGNLRLEGWVQLVVGLP
jgi:hypothetical protein